MNGRLPRNGLHGNPVALRNPAPWIGLRAVIASVAAGLLLPGLASGAVIRLPQSGDDAPLPRFAEGALDNDALLVTDERAVEGFARGDRALRELRADRAGSLGEVFEPWRSAVSQSLPGAQVPAVDPLAAVPDVAPTPRWFQGVEGALFARLELLDPSERTAWRTRFEGLAEERLQAALADIAGVRETDLLALERELAGTSAAARAALVLADRALATGRRLAFTTWLARAERQARWLADPELDAAVLARRAAHQARTNDSLASPAGSEPPNQITLIGRADLAVSAARTDPNASGRPRLLPGLVRLAPGQLAVQGSQGVEVYALSPGAGLDRKRSFEPRALLEAPLRQPVWSYPTGALPGWRHRPAAVDGDLILVEGRTSEGIRGSNALMRVNPGLNSGSARDLRGAGALPELRWAWSGERWISPAAGRSAAETQEPLPLLKGFADLEIQPAPLVLGEVVVATGRKLQSELEQHLFALDTATGEPLWHRFLAKGSERGSRSSRFADASLQMAAAPPPRVIGHRIALTTGLGTFHWIDALDGRVLTSVRLQRKPTDSQVNFEGTHLVDDGGQLILAPIDSEFLYFLPKDGRLPAGLSPNDPTEEAAAHPWARFAGEACALLAGRDARGIGPYLCLDVGGREALVRYQTSGPAAGSLEPVIEFAPREHLAPRGFTDPAGKRLVLPSDRGIYLFDLERDARMVDALAWPRASGDKPPGGLAWIEMEGALVLVAEDRVFALALTP